MLVVVSPATCGNACYHGLAWHSTAKVDQFMLKERLFLNVFKQRLFEDMHYYPHI